MAHHGTTEDTGEPIHGIGGVRTREDGYTEPVTDPEKEQALDSDSSSRTGIEQDVNDASGVKVDPEKGRDLNIIDWWGSDDSEVRYIKRSVDISTHKDQNPMNWSQLKKFFVTFEICLLTFSIYIGSAIYSAGLESVEMEFGISQVAAELGLTLFVAGYGVGPMLWSPMSEIPAFGEWTLDVQNEEPLTCPQVACQFTWPLY